MASKFSGLRIDFPIFAKTYELYKTFYGYEPNFPKKDRYSFGQKCEVIILDFLETVILAASIEKEEKALILKQASVKLDTLKIFFRLGRDLKILDNKKYFTLTAYLEEIGKMLGGWIKATLH